MEGREDMQRRLQRLAQLAAKRELTPAQQRQEAAHVEREMRALRVLMPAPRQLTGERLAVARELAERAHR